MSDNPQPMPVTDFALTDHRVLALGGRDATAFAQAQFMNEVTALTPGRWQWNGWLTPKGRVIALFALVKLDAETLWLVLPDADPAALALQLQRFVFRSKVVIAARDDLVVSGAFALPVNGIGSSIAGDTHTNFELDFTGEGGARTLRISDNEVLDAPGHMTRWMALDLMHGLPRLPESQSSQWTPQQLSLDRLHAYSVKKGCYPGQEVVARTHFLGKVKRGLVLFDANTNVASGGEVQDGERAIGTVVSAASDSGTHRALAVLPLERDAAVLNVAGIALEERPLLGGLAR
ncbi:MAG: folate-binding protein [Luteimonas sp.]